MWAVALAAAAMCVQSCANGDTSQQMGVPVTPAQTSGMSQAPVMTVSFDGEPLALKPGPTCLGDGKNILAVARIQPDDEREGEARDAGAHDEAGEGKVLVDVGIVDPLTVHHLQVKGVGADYFWETSSTGGEAMTVTRAGRMVTVTGKIPNIKDKSDKKALVIRVANCPGT